jgi:glycosyltransferase involved in cell wall biosynthesis
MVSDISRMLNPGVSVVVCCYNSAGVIAPTIQALSRQEIPADYGYEVILIDNNCTDNTVHLAKNTWAHSPYSLRIETEIEPGLIHARKKGIEGASYDVLLFVDDDNILDGDWVKKLLYLFQTMPEVGIIGGYNEALIQGEKPRWFDRYQGIYACGPRDNLSTINPKKVFGAGIAFRTKVIKTVLLSTLPPFLVGRTRYALLRGDDTEIVLRSLLLGWSFYYDSSLKLQHFLPTGKVNWNYVCMARKGGGEADIILRIYKEMLENREPLTFPEYVRLLKRKWKKYFKKNVKKAFLIWKEGSESSSSFYRLLGMSIGSWKMRKRYTEIRRLIIEYFKKTGSVKNRKATIS